MTASLGWFGKAGNGFNGMYNRDTQNAGLLGGAGLLDRTGDEYGPQLTDSGLVLQNRVFRWLGRAGGQGLRISLKEEGHQPVGTITNDLKPAGAGEGKGVTPFPRLFGLRWLGLPAGYDSTRQLGRSRLVHAASQFQYLPEQRVD